MSMKNLKKAVAMFAAAAMIATGIGPVLAVRATNDTATAEVVEAVAEENTEGMAEEEAAAGNTEAVSAVIEEEAGASAEETASAGSADEEISEAAEENAPVMEESAEGATETEIADAGVTIDTEKAAVNEPLRGPVDDVKAMLESMPTLQDMQNKRLACTERNSSGPRRQAQ